MAPGRKSAARSAESTGPPLYFSLEYADNQTAMFNIACQKDHLVAAIRRRCKLNRQVDLQLWTARGELVKLSDRDDQDSLTDVIRSRDVVVLCRLEASKFPGIEPRLVPMLSDLQAHPTLAQLAATIDQRVTEQETKLAQKQQSALRKGLLSSRLTAAAQQSDGPVGLVKGRMAIKRIMMINKMTKRS